MLFKSYIFISGNNYNHFAPTPGHMLRFTMQCRLNYFTELVFGIP